MRVGFSWQARTTCAQTVRLLRVCMISVRDNSLIKVMKIVVRMWFLNVVVRVKSMDVVRSMVR